MNMHGHIFDKWAGKTIERTEYSNDDYEDTWVRIYFTDGTSYTIACKVKIDEYWLDVETHEV